MKKATVRPEGISLRLIVAAPAAEAARWIERLEHSGHACDWVRVERRDEFDDRSSLFSCDAVLFDDALPPEAGLSAADALVLLNERGPAAPLVILSASADPDAAVAAIAAGASDWVPKGDLDRLPAAVARALRDGRLLREKRRSEEMACRAEERLRVLLDQSPDVILMMQGVTGTILRANRAAATLLGHGERELAGKHFSFLLPPGTDGDELLQRLRAGTEAGSLPVLASQPFRTAAGRDVPLDVSAAPLPWGDTRVLLCTLRDVAERDAREEALRRAEHALGRAAGPVIWTDAEGRVCGATDAACERLDYPPGGLNGLPLADIEPSLGPGLWAIHWDELRHYGVFRMETTLRRRDGAPLFCEAEVSLVSHRGREWRCAVLRDPLAFGSAPPDPRLALLRHSPDFVAHLDARGAIVEFVGSAAALFGEGKPTPEALAANRGALLSAWAHPDDAPALAEALERARREPLRPARAVWRVERPGTSCGALVLETLFVNRLADPALRGFVAASRDITGQRLAEERLLRREEELHHANEDLRRAARLKDEFLASLGHELRAPLTAVLNLAEALQRDHGASGRLSPRQITSLETVRGSGRHLLSLLGDLLDLARIEAGRLDLTWEVVSAAAACQTALGLVQEEARRKKISLTLSGAQPDGGPALRADPRRLRQILLNLLANAVAFTPEGGTVRLEVERDAAREAVLFHVVDSGIGIDPAEFPRLFQPFSPLAGGAALARRQPGLGSGLGLSLVSRLVRLHHGAVEVESAPGWGSRFTVLLPGGLRRDDDVDAGDKGDTGIVLPAGTRPLVLLAGNDDLAEAGWGPGAAALADALAGAGFRVVAARGGLETVEKARLVRPDLIVLDPRLDERDGLGGPEVIRRLRAAAPSVPVAALASLSVPGDREACLAAGAAVYLSRPLSGRRLAERLAALLGGQPEPIPPPTPIVPAADRRERPGASASP